MKKSVFISFILFLHSTSISFVKTKENNSNNIYMNSS